VSADLGDEIARARVLAERAGRQIAACWSYDPAREEAAWSSWEAVGVGTDETLRVLGVDVTRALWQIGYQGECLRQREVLSICACCGHGVTRQEWAAHERKRIDHPDGGTLSTSVCPVETCRNGMQRWLNEGGS